MTRLLMVLGCALSLAACGADGEPVRPSLNAGLGVGGGSVHAGGTVGLHKGPLNVYLGF